jgi:spermidine synthase
MIPWKKLDAVATAWGELQLRQRGEREFLITIAGRVLMTSAERTSELAVAQLACEALAGRKAPRVLIGGLGMGYTLRAALDALPATAKVTQVELTPQVAHWCRGPLAPLTGGALADPRVSVAIADVADVVARARPGSYDAIIFDLYEGPHGQGQRAADRDPFYGRIALAQQHAALSPGGVLSIWSEEGNLAYKKRMIEAGFDARVIHPGGSRAYVVYLGRKSAELGREAGPERERPGAGPPGRGAGRAGREGPKGPKAPKARDQRPGTGRAPRRGGGGAPRR